MVNKGSLEERLETSTTLAPTSSSSNIKAWTMISIMGAGSN
jgi:hypothetical protein